MTTNRRSPLERIKGKLNSFWRLSRFEKCCFPVAWVLLGLSRLAILTVSFRRLAPRLGISLGPHPFVPLISRRQAGFALRIGRAIRLAARYSPWVSNCFPQAVTARLLLGAMGIPHAVYFGLFRDENSVGEKMKAHAWVVSGRINVVGGYSFGHFSVVGCFVSSQSISMRNCN